MQIYWLSLKNKLFEIEKSFLMLCRGNLLIPAADELEPLKPEYTGYACHKANGNIYEMQIAKAEKLPQEGNIDYRS